MTTEPIILFPLHRVKQYRYYYLCEMYTFVNLSLLDLKNLVCSVIKFVLYKDILIMRSLT